MVTIAVDVLIKTVTNKWAGHAPRGYNGQEVIPIQSETGQERGRVHHATQNDAEF